MSSTNNNNSSSSRNNNIENNIYYTTTTNNYHHHHHSLQQQQQQHQQESYYNCSTLLQQPQHQYYGLPVLQTAVAPVPTAKNLLETTLQSAKQEICQICASTVSVGLHFGAVTCEACKKFFVRFISNQEVKPVCKRKSGDCVITLKTRADCFHCRLKKCFQVGMSLENKTVKSKSFKEIQCQICTSPSSGTHFGVITCEACKTFYKRNISKLMELKCLSSGNCDVTKIGFSRSLCAYCRLNRCINVGMDLEKSKVGRQSNLVKRNLSLNISNFNNQNNNEQQQHPAKKFRASNNFNDLFNDASTTFSNSNATSISNSGDNNPTPPVANGSTTTTTNSDLLFPYDLSKLIDDENLLNNDLTIDINSAQFDSLHNNNHINVIYQNNRFQQNFQQQRNTKLNELEDVIESLNKYADLYDKECKGSESIRNLPEEDRDQLIHNSVHAFRYLWLHKQNKNLNYFSRADNDSALNSIYEIFPVLKKADAYFKTIHESVIRNLCLDQKEFSLFSALIIFVGGYKGGKLHSNTSKIKFHLSNQLTKYMYARRNEHESYQTLISLLPHYVNLQLMVQKGISERCKELKIEYNVEFQGSFKNFYLIDCDSNSVTMRQSII